MKELIKKFLPKEIIVGFARAQIFSDLRAYLPDKTVMVNADINERTDPFMTYEWVKTFIVCLLPYYCGGECDGLSRYAQGKDYHAVMREYLSPVCAFLRQNGYKAEILCDSHSLNDRYLAYKAGVGFFGRNGFLINDVYGTYTFIGSVATDARTEYDEPQKKQCMGCGMCEKSCPGGAITGDGICAEKCASYITQKKGELTEAEEQIIKKSGSIWGCDICQEVCPHNKYAKYTNIYSFIHDRITADKIDTSISNREFKRKYADYAFAYRGKQPILRNIQIKNS